MATSQKLATPRTRHTDAVGDSAAAAGSSAGDARPDAAAQDVEELGAAPEHGDVELPGAAQDPGAAQQHEPHADPDPSPHGPHGYSPEKDAYLARMRRIEGQVRGIERMIAADTYCIDVLTQISAVTRALQAVSLGLMEDHLNHCVVGAAKASDEEGRAKVAEATAAIARLWKS